MGQEKYPKTHAMNSFFFTRVHLNGHDTVKRWTKKIDIFLFDLILVPVHLGNHWCLIVIRMNEKEIHYYDSLKGDRTRYLDSMLKYLVAEAKEKKRKEIIPQEWKLTIKKEIPVQENNYDCGVFVCTYAEHITADRIMKFSQKEMANLRIKIKGELKEGKLREAGETMG
ncbi:sentrin-specific protease 1-like [Venturia canescens]|uniref:sentrin-specific protease 1-like n=1 Tax=Venturia canescens TaxID=32260 RepID=UPI001C9C8676|nr:sentrin-specific protease 1-like [Venturia canescens]